MPIRTLNPSGTPDFYNGLSINAGSTSPIAVLSDNSDSTWLRTTIDPAVEYCDVGLEDYTLQPGERIKAVRVNKRIQENIAGKTRADILIDLKRPNPGGAEIHIFLEHITSVPNALVTAPGPWVTRSETPAGPKEWTEAMVNTSHLSIYKTGAVGESQVQFNKIWVELLTNYVPVATAVGPNAPVTTTTKPVWVFKYDDADGDPMQKFRIKIFSLSQCNKAGFDPNKVTPVLDSGEVSVGAGSTDTQSWQTPTALQNGTTYRAFVSVFDGNYWSAITSSGPYCWATIDVETPAIPIISVISPDNEPRTHLSIATFDNMLSASAASAETDLSGWSVGANATITRFTAGAPPDDPEDPGPGTGGGDPPDDPAADPVGSVAFSILGMPTNGTFRTTCHTTGGTTSVRLKVGTNSSVTTGVVYSSPFTPDGYNFSRLQIDGLTQPQYWYQYELNGGLDPQIFGPIEMNPTEGTWVLGSCLNASDSAAFTAMVADDPSLVTIHGDFPGYFDGTSPTVANLVAKLVQRMGSSAKLRELLANTPGSFGPSDHDLFANNAVAGNNAALRAAYFDYYTRCFPTATLNPSLGISHQFVRFGVRFIQLDERSFKSPNSATDNASKVVFGTAQENAIMAAIDAAPEKIVALLGDVPLRGTAHTGDDEWDNYDVARQRFWTNYIGSKTAAGKKVITPRGDAHMLDYGSGPGGCRVWHAAPFHNNASRKGTTNVPYPSSGSATVEQYGKVTVENNGTTLTLTFDGYSADGTHRVGPDVVSVTL